MGKFDDVTVGQYANETIKKIGYLELCKGYNFCLKGNNVIALGNAHGKRMFRNGGAHE